MTNFNSKKEIHSVLKEYLNVIPMIHSMLPDLAIGVTDTEEWLLYYPGSKVNLGIKKNQKIDPREPLADCIRHKKVIRIEVPPEFYGFPFTGLANPIVVDGKVIGAIAIQLQEQSQKELRKISEQIVESITHANQRIVTISDSANDLFNISNTLLDKSKAAKEDMKKTDEVIKFINNVATQTNMLGINASIEAARAEDKGRGFGVIANQIQLLSNETVSSTDKIKTTLDNIKNSIESITQSIERLVCVGKEQAISTEEVSQFITNIEKMGTDLKKYADDL